MGSRIRCFFLEPVEPLQAHYYLRRYAGSTEGAPPCPLNPGHYSYHNARKQIEDGVLRKEDNGFGHFYIKPGIEAPPHQDPRWPRNCGCGYQFQDTDPWQLFPDQLYRRTDIGEIMTIPDAPPGAMWNAWWIAHRREYRGPGGMVGPDGISLMVKTPGGDWLVDGPANNGAGWTRQGAIPDVTATPSILITDRYHGFLTAGYLVEC